MRITNTTFLLFVLSLIFITPPAQSQEGKNTTQPDTEILQFKNWAVRCDQRADTPKKTCILFQRVALNSGQTVLSVTVTYPANSADAAAVFRLPLGIFLPAGAVVEIDKTDKIKLVIQRCDQKGCWAPLKLDDKTLRLFKKGREARVGFNNTAGKTIAVPLSLKGFTAGFNEISRNRKQSTTVKPANTGDHKK